MEQVKKIEKINEEIRSTLEAFLIAEENQQTFWEISKLTGYKGDDPTEMRNSLFAATEDGQIGFSVNILSEEFLRWQIIQQLKDKEPFKTILANNPGKIVQIAALAKDIIAGKEITNEDVAKALED